MEKTVLNHGDIAVLASIVADNIVQHYALDTSLIERPLRAYAVPRGGIPALYAVQSALRLRGCNMLEIAENPARADLFIDDIIDSGSTMRQYCEDYPGKPFFALIDKTDPQNAFDDAWVVFPWEGNSTGSIEDNIRRILQYIGDDPNREGLLETPARVAKAYQEWFSGYSTDIGSLFKTFEDGAENCDEMIVVDSIPVQSFCEHHMARFHGVAHIGYIPSGKIVGLSKLARLVNAYSFRLQVQERLTNQIADAMTQYLDPRGVGVVVQCEHTCMCSRGVKAHGTATTTLAMRGLFRSEAATRAEFMSVLPVRK